MFQIVLIFLLATFIIQQNNTLKSYSSVIEVSNLNQNDDDLYFFQFKPNTILNFSTPQKITNVSYLTNGDGLNEKTDIEIPKPNKTIRIVSLGNSFAFGLFVKTEDNYSEKLEEFLNDKNLCPSINKFQVINLGVPGYGFDYAAKHYIDKAVKYEPDHIIWMVQDESISFPSELFYKQRQQLAESKRLVDSGEMLHEKNLGYNNKLILEIEIAARNEIKSKYTDTDRIGLLSNKFALLNQITPIPVSFFSYAGRLNGVNHQFIYDLTGKYSNVQLLESISGILNRENHFIDDAHPNENGHKLISEKLFSQLKNKYCEN